MDSAHRNPNSTVATCPFCGSAGTSGSAGLREPVGLSRWPFALCMLAGLLFGATGAYVATRTLPRYAAVRDAYGFDVPAETAWVLDSGWAQPVPGCLASILGLCGVLRRRRGRVLLVAGWLAILVAAALFLIDWAALLLPGVLLV